MGNKISRKGFLALIFGGIVALFVAQFPAKAVFARQRVEKGYGSRLYGS